MAQCTHARVNQLSRAARQLQLKPSFTTVNFEEAHGPLPPILYTDRWLHIIPIFRGRNRWIVPGLWDRALDTDIAVVNARARSDMRSVAIREADYIIALRRLRTSQPHERLLNEKLASLHRGEYLIERGVLLIRLLTQDIRSIADWFFSTPPHVCGPLENLHEQIMSDLIDLEHAVKIFSNVLRVRLNELLGATTMQHMAAMHKLENPLRQEFDKRHAMQKSVRFIWKQTRPAGDFSSTLQDEEHEFYVNTQRNMFGDLDALMAHEETQKKLALDHSPARWISTSFTTYFEHVMQHQWASLYRQLYSTMKLKFRDDMSPHQNDLRTHAHTSFRRIIEKQGYHLPHPYGRNGCHSQGLFTLVRELQWIRTYRIERFPESVDEEDIRLARGLHTRMRKLIFSRARTENERGYRASVREEERLARESGDGMRQGLHRNTDNSSRRHTQATADARRPQESFERESGVESSRSLATAEQSQRKVPALVMAFQALKASQSAQVKTLAQRSNSSSAPKERKMEPQMAVSRTKEPGVRFPSAGRESEPVLAGRERLEIPKFISNVAPKARHKGTPRATSNIATTKTRRSTPSKAQKVGVGTRLANILHAQNTLADKQR